MSDEERSILVECEVLLSPGVSPEDAIDDMVNQIGGREHVTDAGTYEVCEFWQNEASTEKRMALDTAREEGWAAVVTLANWIKEWKEVARS